MGDLIASEDVPRPITIQEVTDVPAIEWFSELILTNKSCISSLFVENDVVF